MSEHKRKEAIARIVDEVTRRFTDEGRLIEAGFAAMMALVYRDRQLEEAEAIELRDVYMAGAQHLFGSMMSVLDQGDDAEPTAEDLRRMELINSELEAFINDYAKRHGFPPPRPPRGKPQ